MNKSLLLLFLFVLPSFAASEITDDSIHVIFSGDHADPSIVRDGDDFYLTYSSAGKQPDLKVWHSKNLIDWTPISYALLGETDPKEPRISPLSH